LFSLKRKEEEKECDGSWVHTVERTQPNPNYLQLKDDIFNFDFSDIGVDPFSVAYINPLENIQRRRSLLPRGRSRDSLAAQNISMRIHIHIQNQ